MGWVGGVEEARGGLVGIVVSGCSERGGDPSELRPSDDVVGTGGRRDPLGLCGGTLGRVLVTAHSCDRGDERVRSRLPAPAAPLASSRPPARGLAYGPRGSFSLHPRPIR